MYKALQTARAWHLNEPGIERRCQDRLLVKKATEVSHYIAKEINQIKRTRVRRVCGFQADVTAKNKSMDSKNMCRKLSKKIKFGTSEALSINQDMTKGEDGEVEIRPRPWGHLGFIL